MPACFFGRGAFRMYISESLSKESKMHSDAINSLTDRAISRARQWQEMANRVRSADEKAFFPTAREVACPPGRQSSNGGAHRPELPAENPGPCSRSDCLYLPYPRHSGVFLRWRKGSWFTCFSGWDGIFRACLCPVSSAGCAGIANSQLYRVIHGHSTDISTGGGKRMFAST